MFFYQQYTPNIANVNVKTTYIETFSFTMGYNSIGTLGFAVGIEYQKFRFEFARGMETMDLSNASKGKTEIRLAYSLDNSFINKKMNKMKNRFRLK